MSNATSRIGRDVQEHADNAREQATKVTDEAKHAVRSAVDATREKLGEGYDQARHYAQDAYATAKDKGGEAFESIESTIRANPLAAIAVAAGVGVVLGLLLHNKR